ncbi:sensor histidine kinase [Kordiimonas lipolytica]|uniref:histidine kinase n=1 Tax=Kordiimonas lipolytica TaxID=1662421 RepID=A0ABV8UAW0_9PROT|nr:HAMP domain-containing sensor histidine kinase [Kordiimonas lipolytica]
MIARSLRLRLLLSATGAIAVALVLAGFGLTALFDRHVERRIQDELATYLRQLSGGIEFSEDGSFFVGVPLADPRFEVTFSGLYWQVEDDDRALAIHSRSLWDTRIALPTDPLQVGIIHHHRLPGPGGATLMVQERRILFPTNEGNRSLRIAVALDRADLDAALQAFAGDLVPSLSLLGLVLVLAVWFQVSMGLRPLDAIRRGVSAVRNGRANRLPGNQPSEVMPLVVEVNDLLENQEKVVERARQRAGDLAHGLKTPLTILQSDAARLRTMGETKLAEEIEGLVQTMRRHVDRELARVRLTEKGARPGQDTCLSTMVEKIVRTIHRTPQGEVCRWSLDVPADLYVSMDDGDLAELLGNLIDNAAHWALSEVTIRAETNGRDGFISLLVEDDGPGVSEADLGKLGNRGIRLDEQVPGNGLGLAIVRDILAAYGGDIGFANKLDGGLQVRVSLPARKSATL